jgi:hypothetical protein
MMRSGMTSGSLNFKNDERKSCKRDMTNTPEAIFGAIQKHVFFQQEHERLVKQNSELLTRILVKKAKLI